MRTNGKMKNHFLNIMILVIVIWLSACAKKIPPGVTELTYATPYSPMHPFSRADKEWITFVEKESQGSLKIIPNWSGGLLSSDHSMLEIRHGVADIGLITPIYVRGGTHLIRLQSGFYSGVKTFHDQVALYHCISSGDSQFDAELNGLKVLAVQGGSLPGIITVNTPVRSLEDLKGLRIRAPTELLPVLQQLGADPINMPMSEVYSALAKGIIDGVAAPIDTFKSLHFAEITQFYTDLKIPRGAYPARAMSVKRWQSLNEEQKNIFNASISVWELALSKQIDQSLEEGKKMADQERIEFIHISNSDQEKFNSLYLQLARQSALSLERFNIDGLSVFEKARANVSNDGSVICAVGK